MAGIGFELKKLLNKKGFVSNFRAYFFSTIVTVGPMLLCVVLITVSQQILDAARVSYMNRQMFLAAIQYAFIFSQIVTSGFNMILCRYIGDQIYCNKRGNILPSLIGAMCLAIAIGGGMGLIYINLSPLPVAFKLTFYLLFVELIIIWMQIVTITALNRFLSIVKHFAIGAGFTLIAFYFYITMSSVKEIAIMLLIFDLGFLYILVMFMRELFRCFPITHHHFFDFLTYLDKYISIFLAGLFSSIGIYVNNFAYWMSHYHENIGGMFMIAPMYDIPFFYAFLTTIPSIIMFTVTFETSFYDRFKAYYQSILKGGSIRDIEKSKKEMIYTLLRELNFLLQMQLFCSMLFIALGVNLLPRIGFSPDWIHTYILLVLGGVFYIFMFITVQVLMYFDDRKGAFLTLSIFFGSNVFLILLFLFGLDSQHHGLSYALSSLTALLVSLIRLFYLLKNVNYYTFCAQPLVAKEKHSIFSEFVKYLHHQR